MSDTTEEILKIPELPVIEIVDDLVQVYKEYMVVRAALKLNLFSWLNENGPATPEEISTGTGIRPEYMPSLLGTLYYLDMVRKTDDKYSISPASRMNFVEEGSFYQGDYVMSFSTKDSPWLKLEEFLTSPEEKSSFEGESPEAIKSLAQHGLRGMIQNVTNVLKTWDGFANAETFVEMNGGHGLYAIAACQNNSKLKAIVYSGDGDTQVAEEYVKKYDMEDRIYVKKGDLFSLPDSEQADIILISHSLYPYADRLSEVLDIISAGINEGGLFFSNHWFSGPPVGTGMQGLYELELAVHNKYHQLPDKESFEKLCMNANLKILNAGIIRSAYGESSIHMAEKKKE